VINTTRTAFLILASILFCCNFDIQARSIIVNNKQVSTGKVHALESLVSHENALEELYAIIDSHTLFIDFYGPKCEPCQTMRPRFEALAQETDHVLFIKINMAQFPLIVKALGVRSLPTFISFKNGQEVSRIVGAVSKKQLKIKSGVC